MATHTQIYQAHSGHDDHWESLRGAVELLGQLHLRGTDIIGAPLLCADHRATVRDLYDPRFVNDAGATIALLHDANDPSLLPIARPSVLPHSSQQTHTTGFHLGTKAGCLLPRQADQQTTWERQEKDFYLPKSLEKSLQTWNDHIQEFKFWLID